MDSPTGAALLAPSELGDETPWGGRAEHARLAGRWPVQDRAVLHHQQVEECRCIEHAAQIVELAPGYEHQPATEQ